MSSAKAVAVVSAIRAALARIPGAEDVTLSRGGV